MENLTFKEFIFILFICAIAFFVSGVFFHLGVKAATLIWGN